LEEFLAKPLFAHLSTVEEDVPKDSPVWFHWEENCLWVIGNSSDTFPLRINKNPECAMGIVDFNCDTGLVLHAGFRGVATVESFDQELAKCLLS